MSCFPCFGGGEEKKKKTLSTKEVAFPTFAHTDSHKSDAKNNSTADANTANIQSQSFTFRELASATKNFRPDFLLGEGGFGRVYKGSFDNTGKVVAIKQLDRNGMHGNKEFLVEVLSLSLLNHPNLVNLIGYCADGDQRLLVYEFMSSGSLDKLLFDIESDDQLLSWKTRMDIASGAAQGLEYLHEKANPPVIYRDLKASSILLDADSTPKLSDYGLSKLSPLGNNMHASPMMGTYGYCAPEYERTGELSLKSDVYSFGVILLELITGRRVIDTTKPTNEQNLVSWAQPMFKDQKKFPELVDPRLKGDYPVKSLNQAVGVAAMCLQEESAVRPYMTDVVMALSFLTNAPPETPVSHDPEPQHHDHSSSDDDDRSDDESQGDKHREGSEEGSESGRSRSASSRSNGSHNESDSD